jgi:hypothetical protein
MPARPDISADKPPGESPPEYEAFSSVTQRGLLGHNVGPWKVWVGYQVSAPFQLNIGGLVTDGSVRDTDEIINYGFPCAGTQHHGVSEGCHAAAGMQRRY